MKWIVIWRVKGLHETTCRHRVFSTRGMALFEYHALCNEGHEARLIPPMFYLRMILEGKLV